MKVVGKIKKIDNTIPFCLIVKWKWKRRFMTPRKFYFDTPAQVITALWGWSTRSVKLYLFGKRIRKIDPNLSEFEIELQGRLKDV